MTVIIGMGKGHEPTPMRERRPTLACAPWLTLPSVAPVSAISRSEPRSSRRGGLCDVAREIGRVRYLRFVDVLRLAHANVGAQAWPGDAETAPLRHPEHYQYDLDDGTWGPAEAERMAPASGDWAERSLSDSKN